jgi:lipid II:glycine glycyltransferase (peptidoglycan interpeptide bridge formation enzyme)
MEVIVRNTEDDPEWDEFVLNSPSGELEQTSMWARMKSEDGWDPVRFIVRRNGKVVGGFQLLLRHVFFNYRIGYVSKGPVVWEDDEDLLRFLIEHVIDISDRNNSQYSVIIPPDNGYSVEQIMKKTPALQPCTIVNAITATLRVNLSKGSEEIYSQLKRRTRYEIRKGVRDGVAVRRGGKEHLGTLFNFMKATCERRGAVPNPGSESFFHNMWDLLHSKGHLELFLAEHQGRVISAGLVILFGEEATFWKYGWSGERTHVRANCVLYWEIIKWASENNYKWVDIRGIERDVAEAVL